MTINNPVPGNRGELPALTPRITPASTGWSGTGDAIQLSKLGTVLNVFDATATSTGNRLNRLAAEVHRRSYQVDASAVSHKLVREMQSRS